MIVMQRNNTTQVVVAVRRMASRAYSTSRSSGSTISTALTGSPGTCSVVVLRSSPVPLGTSARAASKTSGRADAAL
jgi:hypothetical protein